MTHKLTLFEKHQRGTLVKSRIYGCYEQEGKKMKNEDIVLSDCVICHETVPQDDLDEHQYCKECTED